MTVTREGHAAPIAADLGSAALAVGFGTTVAMWAAGYLLRLVPALVPSWVVAMVMLACLVGGGSVAARASDGGWIAGARASALSSLLNLLVLGSLLSGSEPGTLVPAAVLWVPGSLLAGAVLGAIGGAIAAARAAGQKRAPPRDFTHLLARVAVAATFLLVIAGGIVTGAEAGLAVVDWPSSYGYNMFLYPLSRMTGGIYFEHSHRLIGSLVGLTTLVLAARLLWRERRWWVKGFALGALAMVVVQGLLGGLRVTGRFTTSTLPGDMAPNQTLAIVHGVFGQIFFATMVALAVVTSRTWRERVGAALRGSASADRVLAVTLVVFLIAQLCAGAVLRHLSSMLITHVTLAALVTVLAILTGLRAGGVEPAPPALRRMGMALMHTVGLQVLLGVSALIVTTMVGDVTPAHPADIVVTTAHQANGAALLGLATAVMLWTFRLLEDRAEG